MEGSGWPKTVLCITQLLTCIARFRSNRLYLSRMWVATSGVVSLDKTILFEISKEPRKTAKTRLVKTKKTMIFASILNSKEYNSLSHVPWKSRISLLVNTIRWTMFKMILTPIFTSIFVTILEINHTHLAIGIFSNEKLKFFC